MALGALATVAVAVAAGSAGAVSGTAAGTAATATGDVSAVVSSAKMRSVLRNMGAVLEAMTLAHPSDASVKTLRMRFRSPNKKTPTVLYCNTETKEFSQIKTKKFKRTQQEDSMSDTPSLPRHLPHAL